MNKKINVSVIVPVYNAEKFLGELVRSLQKQTLEGLEFIFINDGSQDGSLNVLYSFAQEDDRIIVIDQKNAGVSVARNRGLDRAQGKYVAFIDADDFVAEDMYQIMYEKAEKDDEDIVSCGITIYKKEKNTSFLSGHKLELNKEDALGLLLDNRILGMSICNKLFRREILKNVRFDSRYRINEDRFFSFYALCNSKKIAVIPDELYFYRVNLNSVSHTRFSHAQMDGLVISKTIFNIIGLDYPQLQEKAYLNVLRTAFTIILAMVKDNAESEYPEDYLTLVEEIKKANLLDLRAHLDRGKLAQFWVIKYTPFFYPIVKRLELRFRGEKRNEN